MIARSSSATAAGDVLHGQGGHALQAIRRAAAEAGVVVVARARHCDRVVDVVDRRDRQPEAAVQHLEVDAVGVHVVEPRDRVAGALLHAAELRALDLLDVVLAQPRLRVELAVHQDPGEPLGVGDQLRPQIAMGVVEEIGEHVDRLVDVCVGIDHRQVVAWDPLSSFRSCRLVLASLASEISIPNYGVRVRGDLSRDLAFPESPRWHAGQLYLAEKRAGRVLAIAADGSMRTVAEIDGEPGGLGWTPDGDLLVVAMARRRVVRVDGDGRAALVADLSAITTCKCNDMIVDAHGNAYVGDFGYDLLAGAPPAPGVLALARPDGTRADRRRPTSTSPTAA